MRSCSLLLAINVLIFGFLIFDLNLVSFNFFKPQDLNTHTIDSFVSSYVNINNWSKAFFGRGYSAKDSNNWELSLEYAPSNSGKVKMALYSPFANRASFPSENQFYPNNNFDPIAVENFFKAKGVINSDFYDSLRTDKGVTVDNTDGRARIKGLWNFTPSKDNSGLREINFQSYNYGNLDRYTQPSIEWYFDPNFVPGTILEQLRNVQKYGVQRDLTPKDKVTVISSLIMVAAFAPVSYLTLPLTQYGRGVISDSFVIQAFLYQLILSGVQIVFAVFLLLFILRKFNKYRRLLLTLGLLDIILFYISTEAILIRWALSIYS